MNLFAKKSSLAVLSISAAAGMNGATTLGESAALYIDSSAAIEYQSNVYRSASNEVGDTIFVLTPGVEFKLGGEGDTIASVKAGYEIRIHSDESDLDAEHARFTALGSRDTGVMLMKGYLGFNEFGTNSFRWDDVNLQVVGGVTEFSVGVAGGEVKYRISDQTAVSGGVDYFVRDYDSDALSGTEMISVPVKVFFTIAPELEALAGYRYRQTSSFNMAIADFQPIEYEFTDHYFFVGVQGQVFSPLWSVDLDVGFQDRSADGRLRWNNSDVAIDDSSALSFSARVNYDADENLNLYGQLSRDFGMGAQASNSYERTRFTVGGEYLISELWSATMGLTWAQTDYDDVSVNTNRVVSQRDGRTEEVVITEFGLRYYPNEYLSVGGSYQFVSVDTSNGSSSAVDYYNNVLVLSAAVRY